MTSELGSAADFISIGGIAFLSLGIMVLFIAAFKDADDKTLGHMLIVAVSFLLVAYIG